MRQEWAALAVGMTVVAGTVVVAGPAAAADVTGVHKSDFNGDGYNDLVTGAPAATIGGKAGAGYVAVMPGGPDGLVTAQRKVISQASAGVPGDPGEGDNFGYALSTGDFNGDGFSDLAVGAPQDSAPVAEGGQRTGSVTVLFGSPTGLGNASRVMGIAKLLGQSLTAADMDGDGRPELVATERIGPDGGMRRFTVAAGGTALTRTDDFANFGSYGLAAGDVDGDGRDDVVTQFRALGNVPMFGVFSGVNGKLDGSATWWPESAYQGGTDAAVGDLDKDGKADIVIGRPSREFSAAGGDVAVWKGRKGGITGEPQKVITQSTAGVPGAAESDDRFGYSVAIGDVTGDGNPELAIGAPGEDIGAVVDGGSVTVLRGSAKGIVTATDGVALTQDSAGVPGAAETHDQFAWGVSLVDYTKDGKAELAVGTPGENNTNTEWPYFGDGAISVLRGADAGPATTGVRSLTATSFGSTLAGSPFGFALGR
ncbi:FG-GAP-like repeat-containing protein [Streptomyces sp. NPDC087917]|uniref:FG-GAP-like repeat-containing protein n=1 Tax=Streptomyces sp. NPDC087917 TaxID=3155060 RepID=UPI0034137040